MKFSILMPAYNDEKYIAESVNSVLSQKFKDWELIIVNDGSTDKTETVLKNQSDIRIKYIYQENSDQLNALINGAGKITGDIVMLLHSDDLLADESVLSEMNLFFSANKDADGLYADYIRIDKESNEAGNIYTGTIGKNIIKSLFFSRGSNPVGDHFAVRRNIFAQNIFRNYLTDNIIYYIDYKNAGLIRLYKFRPWYKYRITDENYASNDIGKFVETNGRIRILYKLISNNFVVKPYPADKNFIRLINKLAAFGVFKISKTLNYDWKYIITYFQGWKENLLSSGFPDLSIVMIDKIIKSAKASMENKNLKPLTVKYKGEKIYYGKDARSFFRDYYNGSLNNFVAQFLNEEYDHIVAVDEKSAVAAVQILNFYCLFYNIRLSG